MENSDFCSLPQWRPYQRQFFNIECPLSATFCHIMETYGDFLKRLSKRQRRFVLVLSKLVTEIKQFAVQLWVRDFFYYWGNIQYSVLLNKSGLFIHK